VWQLLLQLSERDRVAAEERRAERERERSERQAQRLVEQQRQQERDEAREQRMMLYLTTFASSHPITVTSSSNNNIGLPIIFAILHPTVTMLSPVSTFQYDQVPAWR